MPQISQRLKKSRSLKKSSQKWLLRQINDDYVERAKSLGWRSRAAFKIIEIDEKFKIFKKNKIIIDLGSAPGGWSQYAVQKVGFGNVLALDLIEMSEISGVKFMKIDFLEIDAANKVKEALRQLVSESRTKIRSEKQQAKIINIENAKTINLDSGDENQEILDEENVITKKIKVSFPRCDVVLTDMAANATGDRDTDHIRIINLLEESLILAEEILAYGGSFVGKIFHGGSSDQIIKKLQQNFSKVHYFKPNSSRKESSETYLVAIGFKKK